MQLKRILLLSAASAALTLTAACSDKEGGVMTTTRAS